MANSTKKQLNYTISAKHIENLKEFSIPSFQSQVVNENSIQKSKLNSLIKSKSQKQSVNRLSTYSAMKKQ
jgi:hypothetical protein